MVDLTPKCLNDGGPGSRLRLPSVPALEQEMVLPVEFLAPLQIWRARPGEILIATDPQGHCYRARLTAVKDDSAALVPFAVCPEPESRVAIHVYQAIPDKERFELILQKLTELGASRIVPYSCQRSLTREERDAGQKKSHRWPEVIRRAARQCRRAQLPELRGALDWDSSLRDAAEADLALLLYEGEERMPIRQALRSFTGQSIALLIGPEGGFTPAEVDQARDRGIQPVGLGPRILRTETAAISAMTVVQYELGDLGLC